MTIRVSSHARYLLDANVLAGVFLGRRGAVTLVEPWITHQEAATSILVYGEVVEYAMGFADYPRRLVHLQTLLNTIPAYPVTYEIMEQYAALRRAMRLSPSGLTTLKPAKPTKNILNSSWVIPNSQSTNTKPRGALCWSTRYRPSASLL